MRQLLRLKSSLPTALKQALVAGEFSVASALAALGRSTPRTSTVAIAYRGKPNGGESSTLTSSSTWHVV